MEKEINGYKLTKDWFSFARNNLDKVNNNHTAMYLYIVELFNQNQWIHILGLPTDYTMASLNIRSYKTYKKILSDLISFNKVTMIEKSKNQFTSNKIALVKNTKATTKAIPLQVESKDQSDSTIIKLLNKETIKLIEDNIDLVNSNLKEWIKPSTEISKEIEEQFETFWKLYNKKTGKENCLKKFKSLNKTNRLKILEVVSDYVKSTPEVQYRKNPATWLNGKHWNDEVEVPKPKSSKPNYYT